MCIAVCLSARISPELHVRSLQKFWCMLPTFVVRSSSIEVVKAYDCLVDFGFFSVA